MPSMNGELREGATDGKYKKARPNTRVGDYHGDALTRANREGLVLQSDVLGSWGSLPLGREASNKVAPA